MALIFLRHTTPDVAEGVCYGMTDLALRGSFESESLEVLGALPAVTRVVSSPLSRCARLAEFIGSRLALTVSLDERLREMDFGRWEGQRWKEIKRGELDLWAEDFMHARPHGGESVHQLRTRVCSAMDSYSALTGDTLLVTHAGVIKAAFATSDDADAFSGTTPFGGLRRWPP
ncbi:MAG: alpha-ribazole phosphatase [Pseudomonadota bacterium]